MTSRYAFALAAAIFMAASQAQAEVAPTRHFSIVQAGSPALPQGQTFLGAFDLGLLLEAPGSRINDATLHLSFEGASQPTYVGTETSTVVVGDGIPTRITTSRYLDALDQVDVMISGRSGDPVFADDAQNLSIASVITSAYDLTHRECTGAIIPSCYWVVDAHIKYVDETTSYSGPFEYNSGGLQALQFDPNGVLRFGFTVTSGEVTLQGARLDVAIAAVPEPAMPALMLAGAGLLIGLRKFRRSRAVPRA